MSFFTHPAAALRYARARPYFHPLVIELVRERIGLMQPVAQALDVACGTGQSTLALAAVATGVVGLDPSRAMLAVAPRRAGLRYVVGVAEALPFAPAAFDLVTVALGFHWFDRARFLAEAGRVLRAGGWLVIYNNGFFGTMAEHPAFATWNQAVYLNRYPTPARNAVPLGDDEADAASLVVAVREGYTNEVMFTAAELVAYLMTQSNVIAALEEGTETAEDVADWLAAEVATLLPEGRGTFRFGGPIWCLQRRR